MMWHAWLGATLAKAALPIAGAAAAVILSLSVALWWTNSRLDAARATLADARGDLLTCTRANASQRNAIALLEQAQERNRTQREDAIRRQREALARIEELEQARDEQHDQQIDRIVRIADGDACAGLPIPDRLRRAAGGEADRDSRG